MMLVCRDESVELSPEERAQIGPATEAWVEEMDRRGIRLQGNQLRLVSDATTVSVRGGAPDQNLTLMDGAVLGARVT